MAFIIEKDRDLWNVFKLWLKTNYQLMLDCMLCLGLSSASGSMRLNNPMRHIRSNVVILLIVVQLFAGVSAVVATLRCDVSAVEQSSLRLLSASQVDVESVMCHHNTAAHQNTHDGKIEKSLHHCVSCAQHCHNTGLAVIDGNEALLQKVSGYLYFAQPVGIPSLILSSPFRPPAKV